MPIIQYLTTVARRYKLSKFSLFPCQNKLANTRSLQNALFTPRLPFPAARGIPCDSILALSAASRMILINHRWMLLNHGLYILVAMKLDTPSFFFPQFCPRLFDKVAR